MSGWFQSDKPLWLPEGSVRALLVMMLVGTLCTVVVSHIVWGTDLKGLGDALVTLRDLAVAAFAYYFGARSSQGKAG